MGTLRITTAALALATGLLGSTAFAQINLTAATSGPGNSPNLSILHLAAAAGERGVADLQVAEGQTLTNTIIDVAQGRTDIAPAPMILHFLLSHGRGPFASQGENGAALAANLRALYPYNAGSYGLMALESENIDSWDDLEGKVVFNGPPRGAALVNARQAIQLTTGFVDGEDYQGLQANWGQLPSMLVDGSANAFVVPLPHPSERVIILNSAGNVVLVSTPRDIFESEAYQRVFNVPGNVPIVLPIAQLGYGDGVRVVSEDDMIRGIGTAFAEVVHADMDYQVAYDLTAAHIETLDELRARAPYAANVGFGILDATSSGFCGANQLRYHPGAVAAWEDRGYDVPDCAEPE
ncbi:TAXI family TRAP transporter solute-binding subunit [Pararhodobacter sp.]|uniref:TAXI family TRAP transporter solute-binding subunit n=1 Tax=Pararhodobacter sp. TaxID=2127056 RepID=UPI002AFE4788|nr:TAXI family TRAP transporter solute-binding subunit [Pararhodobacter sp.]